MITTLRLVCYMFKYIMKDFKAKFPTLQFHSNHLSRLQCFHCASSHWDYTIKDFAAHRFCICALREIIGFDRLEGIINRYGGT